MFEQTSAFRIRVAPQYVADQSDPVKSYFFFAYHVNIQNSGRAPAQLISRHWVITDGHGHVEHVKGDGVVGEQPVIEPGESYEYVSFCPLPTPTGSMKGSYKMLDEQGRKFEVSIPEFDLRCEMIH